MSWIGYRYWRLACDRRDISTQRRHDFHVAIENWQHDLNIGTVVRTANAFLAGVHIVGRRRWNRRGAMVTDRYQHRALPRGSGRPGGLGARLGIVVVGVDNLPGAVPDRESAHLPRRCVLAVRPGGTGTVGCGPGCRGSGLLDRTVRLDPVDQRGVAPAGSPCTRGSASMPEPPPRD